MKKKCLSIQLWSSCFAKYFIETSWFYNLEAALGTLLPGDCTLALRTLLISSPVFLFFFNHAVTINQWPNVFHQPGICVCLFHHIQLLYCRVQCKLGPPLVRWSLLPWRQEDLLALNGHVYPKIPLEWVLLSLVCYSVLLWFTLWHIQWGTFWGNLQDMTLNSQSVLWWHILQSIVFTLSMLLQNWIVGVNYWINNGCWGEHQSLSYLKEIGQPAGPLMTGCLPFILAVTVYQAGSMIFNSPQTWKM